MAGGKQSPRQKMINMMYLVLTAILALNVAKEVLDAFVVVNIGLLQQKENLDLKNKTILSQLSNQVTSDPKNTKLKMVYENAIKVKGLADVLSNDIEKMKVELISKVDKVDETTAKDVALNPAKVNRKDDYDGPTRYFGTDDPPGNKGKANELKTKLVGFKKQLIDISNLVLANSNQKTVLIKDLEKKLALLNTDDPVNDQEAHTWEMKYFYHMPLSAALLELTKWQNFVKGAESDVLNFLWGEVFRETFKFDEIRAAVIPRSNFVTSGSNFEADIFLAAYSTNGSNLPVITYGTNVDPTTMQVTGGVPLKAENFENGIGKVSIPVNGSGERTFAGTLEMKDGAGNIKTFPFSTTYNVAPPSATIAPTQMNVFYYGLDNPVSISVPGVAPNNIVVSTSGCSLTGSNGTYVAKPTSQSGRAVISVSAKMPDGSVVSMGKQEFRIKQVPTPVVYWGNKKPGEKMPLAQVVSPIIPMMENFEFNIPAVIKSYDLFVKKSDGTSIMEDNIPGNLIPQKYHSQMRNLKKGTKVSFDNIKISVPGGTRTTSVTYVIN